MRANGHKRVRTTVVLAMIACGVPGAVVLDRIVAIAGDNIVKASDVDRELRTTAFLNNEPLVVNAETRRKATDRLIDQQIIRSELKAGDYKKPLPEEVDAFIRGVIKQRYASDQQYSDGLRSYGLTDPTLRHHLAWQLTVIRFINARFRPSILVTDDDVQRYVEQHRGEGSGKAREAVEGERINQQFFAWLDEQRKQLHIEYRGDES